MAGDFGALLGRVVAGKFQIEEYVGGGAMGTVFRARHVSLDTAIALKIMRQDIAKDAMFKERFYREAKAASRLDHPNSVRVIDFGVEPDGLVYLAMEFLHGRDLLSVLREEWPLPDERIVDLLVQTLGAVSVAHELGVVHRDLKPENIMVSVGHEDEGTRPYHVKVCDFGIAKLNDPRGFQTDGARALTSSGTLIGTPEYMSPEQARGDPLDARSDIYSVGIVLYQLLVGRVPFSAENALGVVLKQVTDEPVPPSRVRPGVNPRLEAICLRALKKSRDDRYQTAKEMRRDLRAVFGARPGAVTTDESGAHLPARPPLRSDDDASAPTVLHGPGASVVAPMVSAKDVGADFEPKQTSDGTELTLPLHGGPRWLPLMLAVALLALLAGAAGVVMVSGRGGGETASTDGGKTEGAARGGRAGAGAGAGAAGSAGAGAGARAGASSGAARGTTAPPLAGSPRSSSAGASGASGASVNANGANGDRPAAGAIAKEGPAPSVIPGSGANASGASGNAGGNENANGSAAAPAASAAGGVSGAAPAGVTSGAAATEAPYNPAGAHVALGELTRERIREDVLRAKMSAVLPQLTECYRTALLMMGAPVGGSAEIHMSIDEKGSITTFVNAPKLPPFARCAQRALGSQTVPVSALETSGAGATASQWLTLHP